MRHLLCTLAVLVLVSPAVAADDKGKVPVERTTNDRQILDMLTAVHDKGAALFNAGDHAGCYRMFEGTLSAVRILLPKDLHDIIEAGLADAGRQPAMSRRAMLLHELIEAVRVKLRLTAGPATKMIPLHPPRPVTDAEPLPLPKPDKTPVIVDAPRPPAVAPLTNAPKNPPAPVTTAPPSDDGPILPFTPVIPKPDSK